MEKFLAELFLTVLNMSITGSFVIVGVLLARLLLRRAPKVFSYALWAIVLFRLLCPFSFETELSLVPVGPQTVPPAIAYSPAPQIDSGIGPVDDAVNRALSQAAASPGTAAGVSPVQAVTATAAVVWAAGAAVLLCFSLASCLLLRRQVRRAMRIDGDIYECESITSPFVLGVIHPKIYLPMDIYDERYTYIVTHEQTHIRRRDHLVKPVAYLTLCLHWFNPLCWLAYLLMCRDMEMSCDEAVVLRLGGKVKRDYSETLLALAGNRTLFSGGPLAFGESGVGSRIKNILKFRRPTAALMAAAVMVVVAVGCGLIANPKGEDKASPDSGSDGSQSQSQSQSVAPVPSDGEVKQAAEGLLARGRNVGQIFAGAFSVLPPNPDTPSAQAVNYEKQSTPQLLELAGELKSVDDLKNYVYSTFDGETAETILSYCFNNRYELYFDGENGLLMNTGIGPTNLMMSAWLPETLTVVSAEAEKLVVEMETEPLLPQPDAKAERRQMTLLSDGEGGWRLTGDYILDRTLKRQPAPGAPFSAIEDGHVNYQEILRLYGAIDSQREDGSAAIVPTGVSLFHMEERWGPDAPLGADAYFSWFISSAAKEGYEHNVEAYKSPLGEDMGWFYPQEVYESRIQQYFAVTTETLRSSQFYLPEHKGYQMNGPGGKGDTPRLFVDSVEKEGDLHHISVDLKYSGGQTEGMVLTIRVAPDDTFKFVSCTKQ